MCCCYIVHMYGYNVIVVLLFYMLSVYYIYILIIVSVRYDNVTCLILVFCFRLPVVSDAHNLSILVATMLTKRERA